MIDKGKGAIEVIVRGIASLSPEGQAQMVAFVEGAAFMAELNKGVDDDSTTAAEKDAS